MGTSAGVDPVARTQPDSCSATRPGQTAHQHRGARIGVCRAITLTISPYRRRQGQGQRAVIREGSVGAEGSRCAHADADSHRGDNSRLDQHGGAPVCREQRGQIAEAGVDQQAGLGGLQ